MAAFVLYARGLRGLDASSAVSVMNLAPVLGILFAVVLLGEPLVAISKETKAVLAGQSAGRGFSSNPFARYLSKSLAPANPRICLSRLVSTSFLGSEAWITSRSPLSALPT